MTVQPAHNLIMVPRRKFLIGFASLFVAPAIVRIENIMPVRMFVDDPLSIGIRYQTWPYGTLQPTEFASGCITIVGDLAPKPMSYWLHRIKKHRETYSELYWELMPELRVQS